LWKVLDEQYHKDSRERLRISIVGHANEQPTDRIRYASNYELSQARAEQVRKVLESMLLKLQADGKARPPLNIEWLVSPVADENSWLLTDKSQDMILFSSASNGLKAVDQLRKELTAEIAISPHPWSRRIGSR